VPQRGPSGGRAREEVARRLLSKQQQHDQHDKARRALQDFQQLLHQASTPQALLAHLLDNPLQPVARQIVDTFALLEAYGLNTGDIVFDLSFTRNLDYYTGIVFEYRTTTQDGDLLLGGGGRYDELVGLLGARNRVPAVGFMVLVNNILNAGAARQNGKVTVPLHLLVQTQLSGDVPPMIEMASGLRAAGLTVTTHLMTGQAPSPDQPFTHILTMEAPDRVCLVNLADNTPITFDRRDLPGLLAALEKRS
jgi:histidyl-tRNA synthetase